MPNNNASWQLCSVGEGATSASVTLNYNTSSLAINSATYTNTTPLPLTITAFDQAKDAAVGTWTVPANTGSGSQTLGSLGASGYKMVSVTYVNPKTGQQQTVVQLPSNLSIQTTWG